ncbi:MAG: hypothetical protein WA804_21945 [Terriglobales bacterium]
MTYAELLAEQGASPEDIKLLDTPVARKAYDKMQAQAAEAAAAKQRFEDLHKQNVEWRTTVETDNQRLLKERDSAKIEAAAATARMAEIQRLGLIEVAEGIEPGSTADKNKPNGDATPPDLSKYVDRDTLMAVAAQEGDAIAIAQDIAYEHSRLFPDKPLNFRELRREAQTRKVTVESLWMERFGVQAARDAKAAADRATHEKKIADEAITKYKSEHPETNPLMQPARISATPFTERVPSAAATADHPWKRNDSAKSNERINKVVAHLQTTGQA